MPVLRPLPEELGGRSKIDNSEALAFEQKSNRVSHRVVVVDNVYRPSDRQATTPVATLLIDLLRSHLDLHQPG